MEWEQEFLAWLYRHEDSFVFGISLTMWALPLNIDYIPHQYWSVGFLCFHFEMLLDD